ncbi:MAG: alpha/beta hydrolase family protein [Candidatus Hodarchaeales archaeon]|jgi:hypothetical protein
MAIELILISTLLAISVILITRYTEAMPRLIFYILAKDITSENYAAMTPADLGLTAEFVEIPMKESSNAWFFPSEITSTASILMVPNWFRKEDYESSIKTAGILNKLGYNVLLPIYHMSLDFKFKKRSVGPKQYQKMVIGAYNYFIKRPEVDRRKIGIWSNSSGTILACDLIKKFPIKAVVLEDGPLTLWNDIALMLHKKRNFPFLLTKVVLILLLYPFLGKTRWQSKGAVKNLHACPSFLIALREDPQKNLWEIFSLLHKPRQLWFEHALNTRAIRDIWLQEYLLQIRSFYDLYLLMSPQPEFHYDFSVKKKKGKGKWAVEIRISTMPPQLEKIPLQIILSDNSSFSEFRIWYSGASMTITHSLKYKPNNVSVIQFTNVEVGEHPRQQWIKRDARKALISTIEEIAQYPPEKLTEIMERYFFLKSIFLSEEERKEEAKEILQTITSKHWKIHARRDSDTRIIIQDDFEEPLITVDESILMRR